MFDDFYGQRPPPALVGSANEAVEQGSESALAKIPRKLSQARAAHFDESGLRVAGLLLDIKEAVVETALTAKAWIVTSNL